MSDFESNCEKNSDRPEYDYDDMDDDHVEYPSELDFQKQFRVPSPNFDIFKQYLSPKCARKRNYELENSDEQRRTDSDDFCENNAPNIDYEDFNEYENVEKYEAPSNIDGLQRVYQSNQYEQSRSYGNDDYTASSRESSKNYTHADIDIICENTDTGSSQYLLDLATPEGFIMEKYSSNQLESHEKQSQVEYFEPPLISFPESNFPVKKAQNLQRLKSMTFESPSANWKRVFQKYSPSTEIMYSPVKHIEANLSPNVTSDTRIFGMVWVCGMSEQFYYDNSIILLQKYFSNEHKLKMILLMNSMVVDPDYFLENMIDVNILGSGSFGDVYRVRRKGTEEYYAVKYLKKTPDDSLYEHTDSLLSYLKEKNFLIQARNSPYIVQFVTSLKFPNIGGLFLFFEWCLCDLRKYVNLVTWQKHHFYVTKGMWEGVLNGIQDIHYNVNQNFRFDLFAVSLTYVFEIFCGISFLADCNLVHQDLKPENIMISTNLHLKIADFGLAYNTKFITRSSQIYLVDASQINQYESTNYKPIFGGTPIYVDMEMCYRVLQIYNKYAAQMVDLNEQNFSIKLATGKNADPDFMNDLWACGIMAIELLFGGIHPLIHQYIAPDVADQMELDGSYEHDVLKITYNSYHQFRYLREGLIRYGGQHIEGLTTFISNIFLPRQVRAVNYRKVKIVYRYNQKVQMAYLDIGEVEKIDVFKRLGLNNNNSFLYEFPQELLYLLGRNIETHYKKLNDLVQDIADNNKTNFFDVMPGIHETLF